MREGRNNLRATRREIAGNNRGAAPLDSGIEISHLIHMCNRFRSIREWSDIPRHLHIGSRINFEFNPNVAPTELVPVLVAGEGIVLARFGIHRLGSGEKPRPPLLNVRADGMRKGQFRKHLKKQRCAIPAKGFYEWRDEGGKQPAPNGRVLGARATSSATRRKPRSQPDILAVSGRTPGRRDASTGGG